MPDPSPMNPLQIQVFAGAASGRRARFDRSPITFGREPDNLLVIDDAFVSRYHGELRFEGGQWLLDNKSSNGTKLGRRKVAEKPQPIQSGDEVSVGGKLLFSITIEPVEGPASEERSIMDMESDEAGEVSPAKKKQKMFVMIGVYMVILLGLVIFLSTLKGKPRDVANTTKELTREQVDRFVRQPLPVAVPSEPRYREYMVAADRLYNIRENSPSGYFEALRAFQNAVSVAGTNNGRLKPEDPQAQLKLTELESALGRKIYDVYIDGINRLRRGDDEGSYRAFESAKVLFNDIGNPLYKNLEGWMADAAKGIKGKLKKPK
ncbi:MAG: FHA domain-containing protein [Phycisphaeraceae bacterium]